METAFLIISFLSLLAAVVFLPILLIRRIMHKPNRVPGRICLLLFALGLISFFGMMIEQNASSGWVVCGVFFFLLTLIWLIVSIVCSAKHKKALKNWLATALCFALCVGSFVISNVEAQKYYQDPERMEIQIQIDPNFEIVDGDTPIEVTKSLHFDPVYTGLTRIVYDVSDLPLALDQTGVGAEQCRQAIRQNSGLSQEYKDYFIDFVDRIEKNYPDTDLSILYKNLQTLTVTVLSSRDYVFKSWTPGSCGCYRSDENAIYIPEGTQYVEGEWGFQVLLHEFCHAARISRFEKDGLKYQLLYKSIGEDVLLEECMNSVFSCSLLNYYERDIAYQVPSNYLRIILECMDNFDISDYMAHGDTYFLSKLDEFTGHTNYAQVMWKLITLQRSDYQDDKIDLPGEKYEPIYVYLCNMYYDKYIRDDMTEEEMTAVVDELVDKAFFDAPEEYKTDPDFFYEYLDTYLQQHK